MRTMIAAAAVLACTVAAAAQQTSAPAEKNADKKPITLVGCVAPDTGQNGDPIFADAATGVTYRLTGPDARRYYGKRVQIVGTPGDSKKLAVRGGLYPSPNVAAQAGDMDPSHAAIATANGGTSAATGNPDLPQFRIKSVKTMSGDCPPQK